MLAPLAIRKCFLIASLSTFDTVVCMTTPPASSFLSGSSMRVVDVLCDDSGRVGALSYIVPSGMSVSPGDAVEVPFGKRQLNGMVLGPGKPEMATREITKFHGRRASQTELEIAAHLADSYFSDISSVAARLSPRTGRGAQALDAGSVIVSAAQVKLPQISDQIRRRLYLRAPLVRPEDLAALEASRLSPRGQVLILCPTVELLEKTLGKFASGAARLDAKAPQGAWKGFSEGSVRVGVGTRSAALYSASDLAGIIVLEEDHPGHLEATQPYTNARDVASYRSEKIGCDLTLISANPTTSAMGAKLKIFTVGSRSDWPKLKLIDRTAFPPSDRLTPPPLLAALARAKKQNQPIFILAETRKSARICAKCSAPRPCSECQSGSCLHPEFSPCPRCGSLETRMVGWDKSRVAELFGDQVTPVTASELYELRSDGALVVLFDLDPALSSPSFTPEALPAHLVVTAARAAGASGTLVVLTRQPGNTLVQDLCVRRDQRSVAHRSWDAAKRELLPPFGRLVTIKVGRQKAPSISGAPGKVNGPRKTSDGWEILIRCSFDDQEQLARYIEKVRRPGKVRVTVL